MQEQDPWNLGGGGQSFPFDRVGDEVEGHVIDMDTRQGTDMQTQEPEWWDKEQTRPKLITLLTLQTGLKDNPKDTGLRTITLAGSKKPYPDGTKSRMCAARTAVLEATGGTAFEPGAWFKMRFASEGVRTRPGFNPPKGFDAWYRSPALDLDSQTRTAPVHQSAADPWSINPNTTTNPGGDVSVNYSNTGGGAQSVDARNAGGVNTATGEIRQPVTTGALTQEQVTALDKLGGPELVAQVFGADWQRRVE